MEMRTFGENTKRKKQKANRSQITIVGFLKIFSMCNVHAVLIGIRSRRHKHNEIERTEYNLSICNQTVLFVAISILAKITTICYSFVCSAIRYPLKFVLLFVYLYHDHDCPLCAFIIALLLNQQSKYTYAHAR